MNERISRLMDGEADASEMDGLCELARSDVAMQTWNCYHTIGDALRGEPAVTRNVGSAVARQLASEPTVLAPRAPLPAHPNVTRIATWAWAAAASIAAVTVVGWTAYSMLDAPPATFAKAGNSATRAAQVRPLTVPADYLIAHQEYAPANALQGVGPYLRDVAAASPLRPAAAE